jgi:ATP-dependent Zn protease
MKHQWRYNPLRQFWWRYLVVFLVVFMLYSFLAPAWASGGPGGVSGVLVQLAIQVATSALFAIFFIYIQFFAIARPRVYWLKPYETGITFNDYKGNPQVLEMAREVVILLKGSKDFKNMGGEIIRGLMLEGDPGVGKSYLAQAIASEAGLPFGYCSSPSLQSPFLAGGMLSIKALYRKARKLSAQYGGCILFLDEIDAIGQSRAGGNNGGGIGIGMGGMMGGGNLLINELLVQLDPPPVDERWSSKFYRWLGMDFKRKKAERQPVLTIAATNLVSTLDKALLRPGRFDRIVTVDKPDAEGRREIIEYYLDKVNHENIPVDRFVDETIDYSPVQIKYVINEALVRAHFNGRDAVTYKDLVEAREVHEVGLRQPIRGMTREDKRRLAYHEMGHAVAQALLIPWERIVRLTIVRHRDALGFMQPKPKEEKHVLLKEEIEVDIQVSLASRAAEELFLGSASSGFYGDLSNASTRAYQMVALTGMNGHLSSAAALNIPASAYQMEIENFLDEQYRKVKALLEANSDMCHALAHELLERDELLGDEVMEIINSFEPKLTTDAKSKRKKMGFLRSEEVTKKTEAGNWYEQDVVLAPTGTEGAAYQNPVANQPQNAVPQITVTVEPVPAPQPQPQPPTGYNYPPQNPAPAPNPAPPAWTQYQPVQPPMPQAQPVVVPPATPVQEVPPVTAPAPQPPVQAQVQPTPPPAKPEKKNEDEEDDFDLLPKSW